MTPTAPGAAEATGVAGATRTWADAGRELTNPRVRTNVATARKMGFLMRVPFAAWWTGSAHAQPKYRDVRKQWLKNVCLRRASPGVYRSRSRDVAGRRRGLDHRVPSRNGSEGHLQYRPPVWKLPRDGHGLDSTHPPRDHCGDPRMALLAR